MPRCQRCDKTYVGTKYSKICDCCLDPIYRGGRDRKPEYTKGKGRRIKKPIPGWRKIDG